MRIVAGQWRGRRLQAPSGTSTRPTSDRTRETLFSMLASRLGSFEGLRVADLFAGSGALGLEAMSRGAATAVFLEADSSARKAIADNAAMLGVEARVLAASALTLPAAPGGPFDLIFADPPYGGGAGDKVRQAVEAAAWLAPGGWLAIETERSDEVTPGCFNLDASRIVGRARLTLLRR